MKRFDCDDCYEAPVEHILTFRVSGEEAIRRVCEKCLDRRAAFLQDAEEQLIREEMQDWARRRGAVYSESTGSEVRKKWLGFRDTDAEPVDD